MPSKNCWIGIAVAIIAAVGIGVGIYFATAGGSKSESPTNTINLLLRTINGEVLLLDTNTARLSPLIKEYIYGVSAFDYYGSKTIYYATTKPNEPILSSSEKYLNLTQYTGEWTITAMAVDFVSKKLYVIDRPAKQINVVDLQGKYYKNILNDLDDLRDIVLDPNLGLMFVLQGSKIIKANMDGRNAAEIAYDPTLMALTIDQKNTTIYYATSEYIISYKYVGSSQSNAVIENKENIISLAIMKDHLFCAVAKEATSTRTLKFCVLDNGRCKELGMIAITKKIQEIRAYNTDQGISEKPCEMDNGNGGCEHLCLLTHEANNYSCACNVGWKLNSDSKTCSKTS